MNWLKKDNPLCIRTNTALRGSQVLFFVVYSLFLCSKTLYDTTYRYAYSTQILTQISWICCFLAILSIIFLCRYSIGQLLGILLFLAIYFFIWIHTQGADATILQSMIIVFSCRNVRWKFVLQSSCVLHILFILIPAVLEQVGLFSSTAFYRGDTLRYSFGFVHPNTWGGYCLCLMIIWLLIRYKRLKVYDYIGWILIALFLWLVPNSRTTALLVLLICAFSYIFRHWGHQLFTNKIIQSICLSFGWLMAGFSLYASYFYDAESAVWVWFDRTLFNTRLSCAHNFLDQYHVTFFGQNIKLVSSIEAKSKGTQAAILDNFYVRQLLQYGVISLLIVLTLFTFLLYRALQTHDRALLIGLLIILLYSVYEVRGMNLAYNILLFQIVYQGIAKRKSPQSQGSQPRRRRKSRTRRRIANQR